MPSLLRRAAMVAAPLALLLAGPGAFGQAGDPASPPTLAAAVDMAVTRAPQSSLPGAVGDEAQAWRRRASSWLGAPPSAYGAYYGGRLTGSDGASEADAGLRLPIWNAGQRDSAGAVAGAADQEASAIGRAVRLEVAGLVRETVWEARLAEVRVTAAQEALAAARGLAESVEKRVRGGDLPRVDRPLAQAEVKARETALVEAEAELANAIARYRRVTGLARLPSPAEERRAAVADVVEDHPLLVVGTARATREAANARWLQSARQSNPNVTLGVRRDTGRDNNNANLLLLGLDIPFGTERYAATGVAERNRARVEAEVATQLVARNLGLELEQAARRIDADERALAIAREQSALADEVFTANQKAFAAGEIDLFTLIRVQNQAQAARTAARERAVLLERDVARYNQIAGVVP
jgi:outer membrane protein TolC